MRVTRTDEYTLDQALRELREVQGSLQNARKRMLQLQAEEERFVVMLVACDDKPCSAAVGQPCVKPSGCGTRPHAPRMRAVRILLGGGS